MRHYWILKYTKCAGNPGSAQVLSLLEPHKRAQNSVSVPVPLSQTPNSTYQPGCFV